MLPSQAPRETTPPTLRSYQLQVLQQALRQRVIACLPTGAGKTLVAQELLRARLERLGERTTQFDPETAKICVFVAPTKALVTQQAAYLGAGLNAQVHFVTGDTRSSDGALVDSWDAEQWAREIGTCDVLVMTPELLRRALQHSLIPLHALDCVVLDEAHHAHKNNPMAVICQLINDGFERTGYRPHMLGLTASPVQSKKNPKQAFDQLQATTGCRILVPPEDLLRDLEQHVPKAALKLLDHDTKLVYGGIETKDLFSDLNNLFQVIMSSDAHMSLLSNAPNVLLHAYLRLREADELADVRRTFRTAGVPDPFPVMKASNGYRGHDDGDDVDDSTSTIVHRFVPFLSQAKRLVGALVRITHECGVLCALHALLTALRGDEEDDEEGRLLFDLTWMAYGEDLRSIGTVDVDQKETVLRTLLDGPHQDELARFVDHAAVLQISLVEATIALLSALPSSMCIALLGRLADASGVDEGLTEAHRRTWTYRVIEVVLQQLAQYNDVHFRYSFDGIARTAAERWNISREEVHDERFDSALFEITGDVLRRVVRIALDVFYTQPAAANEMVNGQSGAADGLLRDLPAVLRSTQTGATTTTSTSPRKMHTDPTLRFVSPKLKACWQFLRAYSAQRFAQSGEPWAAMVFCEMRLEADALRKWFRRASEQIRDASIRPCAFVGDSSSDALIPKSLTRHQEVLQQFRKGESNVLFCTNVAEEGLDIPICQLVINFDLPPTVKAFIQRRGRARARDSLFVACVNACNREVQEAQLCDLRKKDAEMNKQLDDLLQAVAQLPDSQRGSDAFAAGDDDSLAAEEADASDLADTYVVPSTGARCDLPSSITLLNQYCQLLPHDAWTSTQPQYTIHAADRAFACELTLPFVAPPAARRIVVSGATSKNAARQCAALLCVQRLHEAGELDDHLVPANLASITDGLESRSQQQQQANQNEDVTVQTKMLPDVLKLPGNEGESNELQLLWYYSVDFQLATQQDSAILHACPNCSLYATALQRVGLVTAQPLPEELIAWTFDSTFHRGKHRHPPLQIRLRLVPHGSHPASSENLLVRLYPQFHELLKACCVNDAAEPFYWHREWMAFRNRCGFSWFPLPANMKPADFFALDEHARAAFTQETITSVEIMLKAMQDATPLHDLELGVAAVDQSGLDLLHKVVKATTGQRLCYVVLNHSVPPSSEGEPHHERIDTASAVEVVPAHINSSLFPLNRKVQAATNDNSPSKRAKRNRLLPVNECQNVGDATWLYAARIMPSFTFLMQNQLLAIELKAHLTEVLPEERHRFIPPLPALLEAITPRRACDAQDSERLEWLGDSALKFAVSVHMFAAHPGRNEMVLDRKRAALISNEHLARVAVDLDIAKYIRLLDLTSTVTQVDGIATVTVKGKAVSDCVEAIIGAFALAGGEDAIWAIVAALAGTPRPTAFDNQEEATRGREVTRSNEQLAQRLGGYKFRNSRLLGAALTHPSSQASANYQRLEYLGDAVLDYIVALRLFDAMPTADPGMLSETKSRLVRNEALAPLAVRMELPRHVHLMNDALHAALRSCRNAEERGASMDEAPISPCLKVLADLVEAIIGAVYVDSDGDLEAVRRVVDGFGVLSSLV